MDERDFRMELQHKTKYLQLQCGEHATVLVRFQRTDEVAR